MWTHNATWGVSTGTGVGQTWLPWLPAVGGVLGMVALVTVMLNLFLLASILLHAPTRSRSFHMHIGNMAVAAILQGAGVLPLWTHYLIQGTWLHGDSVCRWWLATDTMATSVSALAIVVTACDRFIYLLCWRFVREGGKYVVSFLLLFLSWLLGLTLTLTLTLVELDTDGDGQAGVQDGGLCHWGPGGRGERVMAARLIMYVVGAGLGVGLCLALVTLPCLGMGHVLPIDEDEAEVRSRRRSLLQGHAHRARAMQKRALSKQAEADGEVDKKVEEVEEEEAEEEDFPTFMIIKKTDRLEERDRWKWQVVSLLAVSVAWLLLWLPSHLLVFALKVLGLHWHVPHAVLVASVIVGYAHAALAPLLWLLHQPVRRAMTALVFCRCCREERKGGHDEDGEEEGEEFQDVGPYRPAAEVTG